MHREAASGAAESNDAGAAAGAAADGGSASTSVLVPIASRAGFAAASMIALQVIVDAPEEWPALVEEGYDAETSARIAAWTRARVAALAPPALRALVFEEIGIYVTRARMASLSGESHRLEQSAKTIEKARAEAALRRTNQDLERQARGLL